MTRALTILAALLVLVGLTGCGNDEGGDVTTTVSTETDGNGGKPIPSGSAFDAQAVYDRAAPGVVTVSSIFDGSSATDILGGGGGGGPQAGQGSGFVISDEGEIVTNAHVVTDGQTGGGKINQANEVVVQFPDRNSVEAKVIGFDPFADVALIKVDPAGLDLEPVELADIEDVEVGEQVAAIGSPFGERQSLSVGVISALDRTIQSLTAFQIGDAIQTDAAINPGNSGGPLLNGAGEVLGINSQIKSASGGGEGVGFAVPVDTVRRSLRALRAHGKVDYGYLGVASQPLYPQLARRLGLPVRDGALIVKVEDGSPADEAELKTGDEKVEFQGQRDVPAEADVIVSVNGRGITREIDLADLISAHDAGDEVEVELIRDGKRRTVKVKLGRRPERAPSSARP